MARYKLVVGKRINSATLIADARHSWLDALSSAGALAGLWVDPELPARAADVIGRQVADAVARQLPEAGSLTWTSRAAPA